MNWKDLEEEIREAIQRCCQTEEDKERALNYFAQVTVNEMINDSLEE